MNDHKNHNDDDNNGDINEAELGSLLESKSFFCH